MPHHLDRHAITGTELPSTLGVSGIVQRPAKATLLIACLISIAVTDLSVIKGEFAVGVSHHPYNVESMPMLASLGNGCSNDLTPALGVHGKRDIPYVTPSS
jgi:hypothetical protein